MSDSDNFTKETEGRIGSIHTVEDARRAHHLATADPEPERGDGLLTGPAHEAKYGLERAEGSAAAWRAAGVHPTENRALVEGEEGAENLRGIGSLERAEGSAAAWRAAGVHPTENRALVEGSAAAWRAAGVHPTENRALVEGEEGAENLRGIGSLETTAQAPPPENTAAPRASDPTAPVPGTDTPVV